MRSPVKDSIRAMEEKLAQPFPETDEAAAAFLGTFYPGFSFESSVALEKIYIEAQGTASFGFHTWKEAVAFYGSGSTDPNSAKLEENRHACALHQQLMKRVVECLEVFSGIVVSSKLQPLRDWANAPLNA